MQPPKQEYLSERESTTCAGASAPQEPLRAPRPLPPQPLQHLLPLTGLVYAHPVIALEDLRTHRQFASRLG